MSNNQGVWCSKCYGDHYTNDCPEPVASVEAKEKERCEFCQLFAPLHSSTCSHWDTEPRPTPSTPLKSFLLPRFVAAMNDIGRYGYEKYAGQSFQARAQAGDTSRSMDRTQPEAIRDHAAAHFQMHIDGTLHDHFGTRKHQLAAVAFNAMMEYYFAGLDSEGMEQLKSQPDSSSIPEWCDLPNGSGYWWHHDGNPDLRPFIYHVQVSLTGGPRYFIDFPDSRWCDQVGGKWMKVAEPDGWNAAKGQSNGR